MFGHPLELIVVLVLALIFFGPEKLPEVAATAGKFVRELREAFDAAANPEDTTLPDDFSTYYYDSMARSGEAEVEDLPDPADGSVEYGFAAEDWDPADHAPGSHPWDNTAGPYEAEDEFDPASDPLAHESPPAPDRTPTEHSG